MFVQRSDRPCTDIARNADLERDIALAQAFHQLRVIGSTDPVSDAIRAEVHARPHRVCSCRLSRMRNQHQAVLFYVSEHVTKPSCRTTRLISADTKSGHALVPM